MMSTLHFQIRRTSFSLVFILSCTFCVELLAPCTLSGVQPTYKRPAGVSNIPQRVPEADIQEILSALEKKKNLAEVSLKQNSMFFADAFRAFENVWKRESQMAAMAQISALRVKLGDDFIPQTQGDESSIRQTYSTCARMVEIRSVADSDGKPLGPGSKSPAYQKAFLKEDVGTRQLRSAVGMDDALNIMETSTQVQRLIVRTEDDIDNNRIQQANKDFGALAAQEIGDAEVSRYLTDPRIFAGILPT